MAIGPARMPLFDHLGELRMRLVRILACMAVAVLAFYFATPTIGNLLLEPISQYLTRELQAFSPFESFSTRIIIAIWAAFVTCAPIILWQILAFFLPALKPSERKWFIPTFIAAVVLFIGGTVFCYFVILGPAFQWLTGQAAGLGEITPQMSVYIDSIIKFELAFGLAFELPLVVFYLVIFDIVPYKKLRESWRYVYVGLMVFSAMVTMDASPITMMLMMSALVVLYEASLLIARIALARRIKRQNAATAKDEAADSAIAKKKKA